MYRRIKTTKVTKSINKMLLLDLFYLLVKSRSTIENFTQVKSGLLSDDNDERLVESGDRD